MHTSSDFCWRYVFRSSKDVEEREMHLEYKNILANSGRLARQLIKKKMNIHFDWLFDYVDSFYYSSDVLTVNGECSYIKCSNWLKGKTINLNNKKSMFE